MAMGSCLGITLDLDAIINDYGKGTIIIPIETKPTVIKHEFVHHILFSTTGNMDLNHNSEWFIKCGGIGGSISFCLSITISRRILKSSPQGRIDII